MLGLPIAHNAPFDFAFLDAELGSVGLPALDRARMIDTLALAKSRFPVSPSKSLCVVPAVRDRLVSTNSSQRTAGLPVPCRGLH